MCMKTMATGLRLLAVVSLSLSISGLSAMEGGAAKDAPVQKTETTEEMFKGAWNGLVFHPIEKVLKALGTALITGKDAAVAGWNSGVVQGAFGTGKNAVSVLVPECLRNADKSVQAKVVASVLLGKEVYAAASGCAVNLSADIFARKLPLEAAGSCAVLAGDFARSAAAGNFVPSVVHSTVSALTPDAIQTHLFGAAQTVINAMPDVAVQALGAAGVTYLAWTIVSAVYKHVAMIPVIEKGLKAVKLK